jgi:2-oxoglutarate/2-oxoacid ferredoxin oxidoreductase subunit alpha
MVSADLERDAETVVLSFGITSRAAREAVLQARALGKRVSFLGVQTLFPVPVQKIREAVRDAKRVVVAEENFGGLYRTVLATALPPVDLIGVNRVGSMIRPTEILDAL